MPPLPFLLAISTVSPVSPQPVKRRRAEAAHPPPTPPRVRKGPELLICPVSTLPFALGSVGTSKEDTSSHTVTGHKVTSHRSHIHRSQSHKSHIHRTQSHKSQVTHPQVTSHRSKSQVRSPRSV